MAVTGLAERTGGPIEKSLFGGTGSTAALAASAKVMPD
jgi:hypothetical protein